MRNLNVLTPLLNGNHMSAKEVSEATQLIETLSKAARDRHADIEERVQSEAQALLIELGQNCSLDELDLSQYPEEVQNRAQLIQRELNEL